MGGVRGVGLQLRAQQVRGGHRETGGWASEVGVVARCFCPLEGAHDKRSHVGGVAEWRNVGLYSKVDSFRADLKEQHE